MDLSVIVLNYNGKQFLKGCLGSVIENTHNITYEVILVDNASTDGSVEYVEKEFTTETPRTFTKMRGKLRTQKKKHYNIKKDFPGLRIIRNKENYGFSKGNNIGVKEASGEYVCILNNDTIILPDALNNLVHFMKNCGTAIPIKSGQHCTTAKPHIIVTGKVLNFNGMPELNCGRFPTFLSEYLRFSFFLIKYIDNPYSRRFRIKIWEKDEIQEVDWVSGCYFAIERDEMLKLGGFDENFQAFYEDADLCLRFRKTGGKVFYYPFSMIEHLKSGSWRTIWLKAITIEYQSANYFFSKHYGPLLANIFNVLTKATWIFDIMILSIMDFIAFGTKEKIKEKLRLLTHLLKTNVQLSHAYE